MTGAPADDTAAFADVEAEAEAEVDATEREEPDLSEYVLDGDGQNDEGVRRTDS